MPNYPQADQGVLNLRSLNGGGSRVEIEAADPWVKLNKDMIALIPCSREAGARDTEGQNDLKYKANKGK